MNNSTVISLFDESGNAVRDWARAGYEAHCFDLVNDDQVEEVGNGRITYHRADLRDQLAIEKIRALAPCFIFSFPPCTDLAVSGAGHWAAKKERDPEFQEKALELMRLAERLGDELGVRWVIENPVGIASTRWRKPREVFDPYEYGGYLPKDDVHPRYPKLIEPRDGYKKRTCVWTGNGVQLPKKKPVFWNPNVARQFAQRGGNRPETKKIRSETPRGWARAMFEANATPIEE